MREVGQGNITKKHFLRCLLFFLFFGAETPSQALTTCAKKLASTYYSTRKSPIEVLKTGSVRWGLLPWGSKIYKDKPDAMAHTLWQKSIGNKTPHETAVFEIIDKEGNALFTSDIIDGGPTDIPWELIAQNLDDVATAAEKLGDKAVTIRMRHTHPPMSAGITLEDGEFFVHVNPAPNSYSGADIRLTIFARDFLAANSLGHLNLDMEIVYQLPLVSNLQRKVCRVPGR